MSAQKITSSARKLEAYTLAQQRDRAALEIAEREGCSFFEAYLRRINDTANDPAFSAPSRGNPA